MHRSDVPPTPTPTMVGGQTLPPASMTRSMTKVLIAVDAVGGDAHLEERAVLRAGALRDHLEAQLVRPVGEIDVDHRHAGAAGTVLVDARHRMHDRGAQRMLARGALDAAADRGLERHAVHVDVAADDDVVDRDAGVLAEQVVGALGHRDVLDHRREDRLGGAVALAGVEPLEALLDVVRQHLQRADIEELGRLLDRVRVDMELVGVVAGTAHRCMPHLRTVCVSMVRKTTLSTSRPMMMTAVQAGEHGRGLELVAVLEDEPAEAARARRHAEDQLRRDQRAPGEGPADLEAGQDRRETPPGSGSSSRSAGRAGRSSCPPCAASPTPTGSRYAC